MHVIPTDMNGVLIAMHVLSGAMSVLPSVICVNFNVVDIILLLCMRTRWHAW